MEAPKVNKKRKDNPSNSNNVYNKKPKPVRVAPLQSKQSSPSSQKTTEQKTEHKIEQKTEQKVEQKTEQRTEQKIERKTEQKTVTKTDQSQHKGKKEGRFKPKHNDNTQTEPNQKKFYKHGNYDRYYGYRQGEDHRLSIFKQFPLSWFKNKKALDIGCNKGVMTALIARNLEVSQILGIDIDFDLITAAKTKHHQLKMKAERNKTAKEGDTKTEATDSGSFAHLDKIEYQVTNIVEMPVPETPIYDVIFCLSVSKWIHLNYGDEVMKSTFKKIFDLLVPGGLFILEPQPWSSYKKRFRSMDLDKTKFEFHPYDFLKYLTRTVGFSLVTLIAPDDPKSIAAISNLPIDPAKAVYIQPGTKTKEEYREEGLKNKLNATQASEEGTTQKKETETNDQKETGAGEQAPKKKPEKVKGFNRLIWVYYKPLNQTPAQQESAVE